MTSVNLKKTKVKAVDRTILAEKISKILKVYGGQVKLAAAIGSTQQAVSH